MLEPTTNFSVITVGVRTAVSTHWDFILDRMGQMISEGKTDGIEFGERQPDGYFRIYRRWQNIDAANEWVTFLQGLNDPGLVDIFIQS